MANNAHRTNSSYDASRVRPREIERTADRRRTFTEREAKQRFLQKEHPRWALIAYAVFLVALLSIFMVTYTTYAFSKYRGEILPGVSVDQASLAGLSEAQAYKLLDQRLAAIYGVPIRLSYGRQVWEPTKSQIGLGYALNATVKNAMDVGRHETFIEQLIDRLPIHPQHNVPLLYHLQEHALLTYIRSALAAAVFRGTQNAGLRVVNNHIVLIHNKPGRALDIAGTEAVIHDALGALTKQTKQVPVLTVQPVITDQAAMGIQNRVETFLAHPPTIKIGKRVFRPGRAVFAPMLSFRQQVGKHEANIVMIVDPNSVQKYVAHLATQIDRPALSPKYDFSGGRVDIVSPRQTGRTLDQASAVTQLINVIKSLKSDGHLKFPVTVSQPPVDPSNPATLGINTLLATGVTSFAGEPISRLNDITRIALNLNDRLIAPKSQISFNFLVGTDWTAQVYQDREREVAGQLVPTAGGAMQQVATTFLRALYKTGLKVLEVHNHPYRLPWYEPPIGLDALVSPVNNADLRFMNNTGSYLLIETHVEPVRQELYVYVFGPRLGWKVSVDPLGKITKVYRHGPQIIEQDPALPAGEIRQVAWAHNGADTVIERTITYPNGNVDVDQIRSHYLPWRARLSEGTARPQSTPTPAPQPPATAEVTPTPAPVATTSSHPGKPARSTPVGGTPVPPSSPAPLPTGTPGR